MSDNIKITKYRDNIDFIEIKVNELNYVFSNYGASLYSLHYEEDPLIMEIKDKEVFLNNPQFYNKTLGVVAGRIPSHIHLNNKEYHLKEDGDNPFSLHGGKLDSISYKVFKYKIKESNSKIDIIFSISPRKGENGFPGKVNIKIIYELSKVSNKFKIKLEGYAKEDTILNLSNHIYWNLASKDINDYSLKFNASHILDIESNLLPCEVIDTPNYLNFNHKRKLKGVLDIVSKKDIGTIDNTFIFDNDINKVELSNDKYIIRMKTDLDAMNIYCDSSLTPIEFTNSSEFKERRAIALEPEHNVYPYTNLILKKGEKDKHYIEYKITRRDK